MYLIVIYMKDEFVNIKIRKEYRSNPEIFRGEKVFSYKAKVETMNSILIKSKAPRVIDFLSLDTEGAEFEVLNGIDYNKFNFRYIIVETYQFDKLKKFLTDKKYKFVKKFNFNDYLFKF